MEALAAAQALADMEAENAMKKSNSYFSCGSVTDMLAKHNITTEKDKISIKSEYCFDNRRRLSIVNQRGKKVEVKEIEIKIEIFTDTCI